MARDNSSSQLNDQSHQTKKRSASVYFDNELEKSPEPDWRNKERKHRCTTLVEDDRKNTAAWQIDSREKLFTKIDRNPDGVLKMILDMRIIYTEYLNQVNNADEQYNQIQTFALGLEQELQISNDKRTEAITLVEAQVAKSNQYEKIIDTLQNSFPAKKNQPQQSIERPTPSQQTPAFVHDLSPSLNDQRSVTRMPQPSEIGFTIGKFTKALPDPSLFTDGKDPSIDQWLSKMRGKCEINWDHYPSERSKLIYAENRVGGKALQHLEPCLRLNSITPFTTINDLFNHLEDIFGDPHRKKHAMEKFRELKMGASSFSDFYSEFIRLASDLEYTSEMLIREFKHKLTPRLQDRLNSGIELPSTISALAKRCLSIYKQIQATDRIRENVKFSTTVRTAANVSLRAVTNSSRAPTASNNNTSFSHLSNTLRGTITPTTRNSDVETLRLIKERRCFICKGRGHTMINCPEKAKISAIIDASDIDDIKNID